MARLFGSRDGAKVQRNYTKRDDEHWTERPTLASLIHEYLSDAAADYGALRDYALEQGYSVNTFYDVMATLRDDGTIAQSEVSGDYYNGDDGL